MGTETLKYDFTETLVSGHDGMEGQASGSLKKCPFCAEMIQAEAVKCRYCMEFLNGPGPMAARPQSKRGFLGSGSIGMALLFLGPLALPLVWLNQRYRPVTKIIITVVVLGVTLLCLYLIICMYERVFDQIKALGL